MLAALPAQSASGLQSLFRTGSRSKEPETELQLEQQANPDSSLATLAVQGPSPSQHHPDSFSHIRLPAAAASAATAKSVPFVSVVCRHFTIGKLRSDFPSRVEAYPDRLEYNFKHPGHGKTHMVMYFRDFGTVQVKRSSLIYKITTPLNMFSADYNPADPQHLLSIVFDSPEDLRQIHHAVQEGVGAHKAE